MTDVPWENIFKLGASTAASDPCEWVQVGADVYITHRKYQVKPYSLPSFSAVCAAGIVHRNQYFRLYQKDKFSGSKLNSDRLVIVATGVLKLPSLHMQIKQKSPLLPRILSLGTFGKLSMLFSTKVDLLDILYSTPRRCYLLHLIKQSCFVKTFLRTLILMTQVSPCLFFLLELI